MKTIWKFPLILTNSPQSIEMPSGAAIIRFGIQGSIPSIWAVVNPDKPLESRVFHIRGTGHCIESGLHYIGSCEDDPFVWHIFEYPSTLGLAANVTA